MIEARSTGTATVVCGLASARIEDRQRERVGERAARGAASPGVRGATDACSAGMTNAAAAARRVRSWRT